MIIGTTRLANEILEFINAHHCDWVDVASEFGFVWDSDAEEYLQAHIKEVDE